MKAVLFDLDDTLYDYAPCHAAGLETAGDVLTASLGVPRGDFEEAYARARHTQLERLGPVAPSHSRELYFKFVVDALAGRSLPALSLDAHEAYWEGYLSRLEPAPGCRELLEQLRGRARLGLVTNMTVNAQLRKLMRLGLDEHFEVVVTSAEADGDKPHPSCFRLTLARLGLPAREVVMIGDSLEMDVHGAVAEGLRAVWLRQGRPRQALPPAARSVEDLMEMTRPPWSEVFPEALPPGESAPGTD